MAITVMKFGGSCFVNSEAFGKIQSITELYKEDRKVYVASALNGITDKLVQLSKLANTHDQNGVFELLKVIEKCHLDTIDEILSDNPEIRQQALDFVRDKLIEIQQALDDIGEFGLEPYFSDLVLSFGEKLSTLHSNIIFEERGL